MLGNKFVNPWTIGLNALVTALYFALEGASSTVSIFKFLTLCLITLPFCVLVLQARRILRRDLQLAVSIFGTALLWLPLYSDVWSGILSSTRQTTFVAVSVIGFSGVALLLISVWLPTSPASEADPV